MDNNTEVMTDEELQAVSGGFDYVSVRMHSREVFFKVRTYGPRNGQKGD